MPPCFVPCRCCFLLSGKFVLPAPALSCLRRNFWRRNAAYRRASSFLGECPDTPRLLAESDIFALITNWEAFPISILESMRAGLPVIATDIGGIHEAVEDGVNGFLVPWRNEQRLAEKLAALITSAVLRRSMGSQSRKLFLRAFEWRSMLDKTEGLYMTALQEAPVLAMESSSIV